jgi:hypothetical protein
MNYIFVETENGGSLLWHKARDAKEADINPDLLADMPSIAGMKVTNCGIVSPGIDHDSIPQGGQVCSKCGR